MLSKLSALRTLFGAGGSSRRHDLKQKILEKAADDSGTSSTTQVEADGSTGWKSFSRKVQTAASAQDERGSKAHDAERDSDSDARTRDGMRLDVRRIDEVYDRKKCAWVTRDTPTQKKKTDTDRYAEYAFTLNRRITENGDNPPIIKTSLDIRSTYLRDVGSAVIGANYGISWASKPLQVEDKVFIASLPKLQDHYNSLKAKEQKTEDDLHTLQHLSFLLNFLRSEYASLLSELSSLLSNGEITFDLMWAIFTPKTILYTPCPVTSEPRTVRLIQADLLPPAQEPKVLWRFDVEYVEYNAQYHSANRALDTPRFGLAKLHIHDIFRFKGAMKLTSLPCYPVEWCQNWDDLRPRLLARARKWTAFQGVHHLQYDGLGYHKVKDGFVKISINSRVMIDWKTFAQTNANYTFPNVVKQLNGEDLDMHPLGIGLNQNSMNINAFGHYDRGYPPPPPNLVTHNPVYSTGMKIMEDKTKLDDTELLLASPIVYGFSLSDKVWLEFNVDSVTRFAWDDEPFENLVLAKDQKELVKSLVEAQTMDNTGFDDFVKGKGKGLVINLFGNPGVGKSLTAEATSEHLRKPLYVVGAGDLGTSASVLDDNLTRIFKISAGWGAVLLIDEADVFLEERSFHDLERNAMVAVFLRELEYFRGILFLTTNRVRAFDEAFQSRIHVALHYEDLSGNAKRQIWVAFLKKAMFGVSVGVGGNVAASASASAAAEVVDVDGDAQANANAGPLSLSLSADELHELSEKKVNGRQIKNVVRTASALALGRKQTLGYRHLVEVLDMLQRFDVSNGMYQ